jgi:hypothetical protein
MRKSLEDIKHIVREISYPGKLPEELKSYHYYILDSGHCIMCVLECHLIEAKENMDEYELPIPVSYVLEKGYKIVDGYVVVKAEYSSTLGLMVDEKYNEF